MFMNCLKLYKLYVVNFFANTGDHREREFKDVIEY